MYIILQLSEIARDAIPLIKEGYGQEHTPKLARRQRVENQKLANPKSAKKNNQRETGFQEDILATEPFRIPFKFSYVSRTKDSQSFQSFFIPS